MPDRERALRYTAPALLVAAALLQQALVPTVGLSPWKGAGFGMFANADDPRTREIRVVIVSGVETVRLDVARIPAGDKRVHDALHRARHLPTARSLRALTGSLDGLRWTVDGVEGRATLVPAPPGAPVRTLAEHGDRVEISVFARHVTRAPIAVRWVRVAHAELDL